MSKNMYFEEARVKKRLNDRKQIICYFFFFSKEKKPDFSEYNKKRKDFKEVIKAINKLYININLI